MFNRFTADAHEVAAAAERIARELCSPTVEAEHLLLAVAEYGHSAAGSVLREHGLDRDGLELALEAETDRSLAVAGVALSRFELPPPAAVPARPRWAASAKLALERALRQAAARSHKRIGPGHVALGVLQARTGTVPRALACAGVDRIELTDRMAAVL